MKTGLFFFAAFPYHYPYYRHDIHYHVLDGGSDSSDVELEELPAGSIQARGSRGGISRLPSRRQGARGRGEGRLGTGEGTSRGPGELGSNFNPSENQTNKQTNTQTKQTNQLTNKQTNKQTK